LAAVVVGATTAWAPAFASGWWNNNDHYDRWRGGPWYGGYPGYYGWGGNRGWGYGGWGYGPYGYPGYGWGSPRVQIITTEPSHPARPPEHIE